MDAVALAKEFAEDCLEGATTRDGLREWLYWHDDLTHMPSEDIDPILKQVKVALDSKIIITIK